MFDFLNAIDLRQIMWLIPIVLLFHELEEWNIRSWHIKNSMAVPGESVLSTRMWILFLSAFGFFVMALAAIVPDPSWSAGITMALVSFTLLNGLQHMLGLLRFKGYHPGLFFAAVIGIPVGVYITYRIFAQGLLPVWLLILFGVLILVGLAATFKIIHFVNRFGIRLADWVSN